MASLRRPSAAIPRGQGHASGPLGSAPRPPPMPEDGGRKRDARKSKVGDKIKKRLSMRYVGEQYTPAPPLPGQSDFLTFDPYGGADFTPADNDNDNDNDNDDLVAGGGETYFSQFGSPEFSQSGFGKLPQAPSVPISSGGAAVAGGRRGAADHSREEEWDLEELGKDGFDLAGYVRRTLTGADEDEKKRFRAALMRARQGNAKELQRNVFKHYAEFVTISKEISTLENDMLELKELLGQWKDLPQLMGMEATLAPTLDKNGNLERRRTQRNSVLDLQNLYKTQLTQLWSTVEGSQKYLPLVPGRHLVFETHNFVELNAATYKAKQSVSLFLLNDLLLIAGRRRTKGATTTDVAGTGIGGVAADKERERGRMVAERCWVLADLIVVDVKDSGDLTNALKIRRGKEVCVYRTSKPEDKKALLGAFRQVSQELGEKKRKDSEKEQERRKSMWHGDKGTPNLGQPSGPGGVGGGRPLSMIGISMADSKDLRWIDEYGDELTMAIATRDWEEAVKLVEKGRDLLKTVAPNPSALSLMTACLDQLVPSLITQISFDLSSPQIRKSNTSSLVSLLVRLDRADLARDTFLRARREVMLKRVRGIKCEGDISIYISELAIVCFTVIRHTSDWYMSAFKENKMASGFVTWAKEQIETFADLFRRQVYAPNIGQSTVDECIHVTASHNRKLLRDVGLDFTYLLSTLLQPDPKSSDPHPIFNNNIMMASTPAPGYHIEPSPYVSYVPDTPAPAPPMGSRTVSASSSSSMKRDGSNGGGGGYGMRREGSNTSGISMTRQGSYSVEVGNAGGSTAPLSIPSRAVRRPSGGTGQGQDSGRSTPTLGGSAQKQGTDNGPMLPPRSERRGRAPPRNPDGSLM
ncbi:hypothetical protein IAR55_006777 [Kwoniella newhampshirensis]|uniref:Exocyst complex component EXO84 n=1 Tax=Kwoniella newhampshirensis TaxID=1651941 RepID=A0AAW0YDI2_9TREE